MSGGDRRKHICKSLKSLGGNVGGNGGNTMFKSLKSNGGNVGGNVPPLTEGLFRWGRRKALLRVEARLTEENGHG